MSPRPDFSSVEAANGELGSTWKRYGHSKLVRSVLDLTSLPRDKLAHVCIFGPVNAQQANILFSVALQDRLKDEKIFVSQCIVSSATLSLHPTAFLPTDETARSG